ncbi:hypothetical protein PVAND_004212 [Polypedilum vanderplanki]|uniref:Uncharacterized protein n=1 Tax=Polypedilum vanderplanki TaxID=319348 RepID=A0A9J6BX07_POLVA|nr:hypothetical protein PVAND_004212 [Polypedilum vanderplanki]
MKRKGIMSIHGIIRVYDYCLQIRDSSIILFIASKDEYNSLINKGIIRILGQRIKIIPHELLMKTVLSCETDIHLPTNLMLYKTCEVFRPLLSDYLILELERFKFKMSQYEDLNGMVIPFFERRQQSRNFIFLVMAKREVGNELIKYAQRNWTDGRMICKADNALVVMSKIKEMDFRQFEFGKYNKVMMNKEIDEMNFISTNLHNG